MFNMRTRLCKKKKENMSEREITRLKKGLSMQKYRQKKKETAVL